MTYGFGGKLIICLQVAANDAIVMLMTRARAHNSGRRILNRNAVEMFLRHRYGNKLVVFSGGLGLSQAVETFGKVRIIIGVHGGALYNMNFAPLTTTIIEFGPTLAGGKNINNLAHTIFWAMADLLGQPYWRVPFIGLSSGHDLMMNVTKLKAILDIVDRNASFRRTRV